MNAKPLLIISLALLLFACASGGSGKEIAGEVRMLHDSLMKLHDETMASHSSCLSLIDELKDLSAAAPDAGKVQIDSVRTELDYTSEIMMDWMAAYQDPVTEDTVAAGYLKEQIKAVREIARIQELNLGAARVLLKKENPE
ncbi:MAG TPA: hypothetical protein PKM27_10530 [Saprospiraceae bacterium]|nr:hypothetical protein [Saprospiraceae bacterium]HNT22394.1 hypothetical protein [Saprospiraceae bacterium]